MNIHVFMLEMFHDEWLLTWISAHPLWGRSRLRRPVCRCLRKPWEPESEGSHNTTHGSLKNFRSTYAVPKIICHLHCPKKYLNITIKGKPVKTEMDATFYVWLLFTCGTLFEKLFLPTGGVKMFHYLSLTCLV